MLRRAPSRSLVLDFAAGLPPWLSLLLALAPLPVAYAFRHGPPDGNAVGGAE